MNKVAIVCGGGPAPGMNGVIAAVTLQAKRLGWGVLGMYDGFSHLAKAEKCFIELNEEIVRTIPTTGGCYLRMSRYNPTKSEADLKNVVNTFKELGVTHLVTIGGDDTAFSSKTVAEYAQKTGGSLHTVHVPKTIDNDLPLPEGVPTFGFETARAFGATEVLNLLEDARTSSNRWYFVIAMGRTAGHLALGIGQTAAAPITIIPEEFAEEKISLKRLVDMIASTMIKQKANGKPYGVAVVAEGVMEKIQEDDLKKMGNLALDEHGHIRYAELDFGALLKKLVLDELKELGQKFTIVDKEIGYELRCASPIAYDREYTRSLGLAAVEFLAAGKSGAMISMQNNVIKPLTFEEIQDPATGKTKVRRVNVQGLQYQAARKFMTRLEKEDLQNEALAKNFGLSVEQMNEKYGYLF